MAVERESRTSANFDPQLDVVSQADVANQTLVAVSGATLRSPLRDALRRLRRDRAALVGLALIVIVLFISIFASLICPFQPDTVLNDANGVTLGLTPDGAPIGPNATFRLGTDDLGRDILTRVFYGGRVSLLVALISNVIALVFGTLVGVCAAYFGGLVDIVLSRLIEIFLAFPIILFAIALAAALKPSLQVVIISIALISWTSVARVVRGQVLALKERDYVEAARAVGSRSGRIMFYHILPHLVSPLLVIMALAIPSTIVLEASLSFLGVGVPPDIPSWGNMLDEGTRYYLTAPWIVLVPGLAVFFTVFGFNLFGDGVRDALDPKDRR